MVVLRPVLVFAQWVSSSLNLSWSPSFQSSWLVFSVFMVWSLPSSSFRKVHLTYNTVPANNEYKPNAAYAHLASGLCCGFSSLVTIYLISGCWFSDRYCRRRRCKSKRATGQDFRRNDFDIDFRLSLGLVWSHRVPDLNITRLNYHRETYDSSLSLLLLSHLSFKLI